MSATLGPGKKRHILFIGAHPDDCDFSAGGTAAIMAARGDEVCFLSVTNGDKGHFRQEYIDCPERLAARRYDEGVAAAAAGGARFDTMGLHDGEVYVTPESTHEMIRRIRSAGPAGAGPDAVLVNRPNDYHRDHRYTTQLVLDAFFLLTVPTVCPDVAHLRDMPVLLYWFDRFHEGGEFRADVVVPIDAVLETKVEMGMAHASQIFEWLPYNVGRLEEVPASAEARRQFVRDRFTGRGSEIRQICGAEGLDCLYCEAFQVSEYGRRPGGDLRELFPGAEVRFS